MKKAEIPFNIKLLNLTPDKLKMIKPVRSLDIFDQTKTNFHEDGLYSVSIFGPIGDPKRSLRFSYIDIKIPVFHPVIYLALERLKALYIEIIEGKTYAIWNAETKDFDKSNQSEGETGFFFFLKHWKDIQFVLNKSITRIESVKLIEKYKDIAMTDKVVVLPAGLREVEYTNDRITEDEVNDYYRRLLSASNTLTTDAVRNSPELLNRSRVSIQRAFNELYNYFIERLLKGKKKFILGKWTSRRIFNSTRNVVTSQPAAIEFLGSPDNVNINITEVGMYQLLAANGPISKYLLKTGFLSKVFTDPSAPVKLVNKKTLKAEELNLKPAYYDTYMTDEGLDKLIALFGEESLRHKPLEIEGHYIGLIYKGFDHTFKIIQDIDDLPASRSKDDISPLTFAELLYCSIYKDIEKYPAFVTRYPVTGVGSIYPSKVRMRVTVDAEVRKELRDDWLIGDEHSLAKQFPIRNSAFVNTFSPSPFKLAKLGMDFDGDTGSFTTVFTQESLIEINGYLNKKQAYVGTDGKFINSTAVDLNDMVFFNLTHIQPSAK